jgi:hypothetical protein
VAAECSLREENGQEQYHNNLHAIKIAVKQTQYPQFFLTTSVGKPTYVGNWDAVEGINDNSGLPETIL